MRQVKKIDGADEKRTLCPKKTWDFCIFVEK